MPEIKKTFTRGRMNLDLDERLVPNGEYREALNVQVSTSEDSDIGSVQNVMGNIKVPNQNQSGGEAWLCIGSIDDEKNNTIYSFIVRNTNGIDDISSIVQYDVDAQTWQPVIVDVGNNVLEFNSNTRITGINIVDEFLFFTDGFTEPKKINIIDFLNNNHIDFSTTSNFYVNNNIVSEVTKDDITVIKKAPKKSPNIELIRTDTDVIRRTVSLQRESQTNVIGNTLLGTQSTPSSTGTVNFTGLSSGDTLSFSNIANAGNGPLIVEIQQHKVFDNNIAIGQVTTSPSSQAGNIVYSSNTYTNIANVTYTGTNSFEIWDAKKIDIKPGDVLLLVDSNAISTTLPDNAQIRLSVDSIRYVGGQAPASSSGRTNNIYAEIDCTVLSVTSSSGSEFDFIVETLNQTIFEKDFFRFSYRYKYKDGEYSAFGPFTQPAFLPGIFGYHPTREPYNVGMETKIKKIILTDFVTFDIPKGVVEIDLLCKPENSNVVFSIDTIKPFNADGSINTNWHNNNLVDYLQNINITSTTLPSAASPSDTGIYEINSDNIYAALPSNQILRPFDNVPKKAKAQDFTANRIIYGNYTQNLLLNEYDNDLTLDYEAKAVNLVPTDNAKESIKSLRTYQAGIIFGDKYGRETPVFTSGNLASLKIPFEVDSGLVFSGNASRSNRLTVKNIPDVNNLSNTNIGEEPYYFKLYVKETSSEYYNLVLDRVYRAEEDGNLWLSFPSSGRNKLKEDDYIILKKSLDSNNQVEVDNKFKVIDIQNEAPEFIRKKFLPLATVDGNGTLSNLYINSSLQPAEDIDTIIVSKDQFEAEGGNDLQKLIDNLTNVSITFTLTLSSGQIYNSQRYLITSLATTDGNPNYYTIILDRKIEASDAWVESSTGVLQTGLKTNFWKEEVREWEEYQGRFFVKILSNIVTAQYLEPQIGVSISNVLEARTQLFSIRDEDDATEANYLYAGYKAQDTVGGSASVSSLATTNTSQKTTTQSLWQDVLKFQTSGITSKWFVDQAFTIAQQPTIAPDVSSAGFDDSEVGNAGVNGLKFDVSGSGNLRKLFITDSSGSQINVNWITGQDLILQNDGCPLDGIDGIIEADGYYNGSANSVKDWKKQLGAHGQVYNYGSNAERAYGSSGTNGVYMHLSFSSVGTQLHDGTNLWAGGSNNIYANPDLGSGNVEYDLQSIDNFNTQPGYVSDPSSNIRHIGVQKVLDGNCVQQNNTANVIATENQWNPAGHPDLGNFNASNKSIVDNLVAGNQFVFANDTNGTVFTIKNVTEKRLYNHTSWNRSVIYNGTSWEESTNSVHYAWWQYRSKFKHYTVSPSKPNSFSNQSEKDDALDAWKNLMTTLKRFSAPDNRRVMYIIELDKDPSIECSNDPEGFTFDGTAATDSTFIEFRKSYIQENASLISDNPAVFETEPKENIDLEIYYEASNSIPIELDVNSIEAASGNLPLPDNSKSYLVAPVGTKVETSFQDMNTDNCFVESWDGDIVTLRSGLLPSTNNSSATNSLTDQTNLLTGHVLKFFNKSNGYAQYDIVEVIEILNKAIVIDTTNGNVIDLPGNKITKIKVNRKPSKVGLDYFNCYSFGNGVESNRIRDDFNKPFIKNGVKASTVLKEQYKEDNRTSGLIFSGLYNKSTSLNDLNQFIMAEKITKELEPTYGSIQKLFARDSDLIALCEDKIVQIAADKDILFNADGNPQVLSSDKVLGQSRPFVGEYGISQNPESFAFASYRAYFTDKQRGAVLRLSMDGLTPISEAGMTDWFRDKFKNDYFNIIGSYDKNKNEYNLTFDTGNEFVLNAQHRPPGTSETNIQPDNDYRHDNSITVTYKENVKGWVSFKSFIQESGVSCANKYFTFRNGLFYEHIDTADKNSFYDNNTDKSFITALFNEDAGSIKTFNTLNYTGGDNWVCENIETNIESGNVVSTDANSNSVLDNVTGFVAREGKYFASIVGDNTNIDYTDFSFQGLGTADSIENNI